MGNIIKSQFYQLKKYKLIFFSLVGITALLTAVPVIFDSFGAYEELLTGSEYFAGGSVLMGQLLMAMYVAVAVAMICGGDFPDKTANYELMSGHLRRDIYLGRAVVAYITAVAGWFIISFTPVIVMTAINGWGDDISVADMTFRALLMLFPLTRMVCEFVMLTFLIKNPYVTMCGGYFFIMVSGMISETIPDGFAFMSFANLMKIGTVDAWVTYGLHDGGNFTYDPYLPADVIAQTIIVSVIVGAAALYLGYIFFKNDDMN